MGSDPQYTKYPDLSLAQDIFKITNPACPSTQRDGSLKKLQSAITEHKMAPLYRHLAHPVDGILNTTGEGAPQSAAAAPATGPATAQLVTSNLLPARRVNKVEFPWDEKLYESLVAENNKELEAFQKEEDEAEQAAGETELQAARGKRAEFWARVGDKVRS